MSFLTFLVFNVTSFHIFGNFLLIYDAIFVICGLKIQLKDAYEYIYSIPYGNETIFGVTCRSQGYGA